jgi:hypothetical protein
MCDLFGVDCAKIKLEVKPQIRDFAFPEVKLWCTDDMSNLVFLEKGIVRTSGFCSFIGKTMM